MPVTNATARRMERACYWERHDGACLLLPECASDGEIVLSQFLGYV